MPNPMINRPKTVHYSPVTLFMALLISGSLWVNSLATPSAATALATRTQDLRHPNKKRYLLKIDQQLHDLEARIGHLRARRRSLRGSERDRLSANIRMLQDKLHGARSLWKRMQQSESEWLKRKKELDTKVIRLQKSVTYVINTLSSTPTTPGRDGVNQNVH